MLDVLVGLDLPGIRVSVDLEIDNEILVLFGPSGAGKSLTVKMIAGLERPDRGHVRIGDQTVFDSEIEVDLPPQQRNVGYVPQRSGVFPHLTALENVALPLRRGRHRYPAADAEQRALELLERFGLRERAAARPAQMSGGEIQRVAFARVLAGQPDVLLVDEPFAALDAPVRAELRREFRQFQRDLQIPAIFITHDVEEAAVVGDRIAIMIAGGVRQIGKPRAVLDAPFDRAVAELVQSGNIFDGWIARCGERLVVKTLPGAFLIPAGAYTEGAAVSVVIRPEGIRVLREDRDASRFADSTVLTGTLTDVADHGTLIAVTVAVGGGALTVNLSPTAASNLRLEAGNPIRLAIPPERVHLIVEAGR
jgi:molybdate transport system ATP-binding protein